jgi:hypothetical protein
MDISLLLIMAVPACLALLSAWGAVMLYQVQIDKSPLERVFIWFCIVVLASFSLAVGSCFAMFFSNEFGRIH